MPARRSWWLDRSAPRPPLQDAAPHAPDLIVVGGGIAGVGLARDLARAGARVLLVEGRRLGEGASGRNAGFVLAEGAQCYAAVAREQGRATADALREAGLATRAVIEAVAGRQEIGWQRTGSLRLAASAAEAADLRACARLLGLRWHAPGAEPGAGLPGTRRGGLVDPGDGVVDPLALLAALAQEARAAGAVFREEAPVTEVARHGNRWRVRAAGAAFEAPRVVLAASVATGDLLPAAAGGALLEPHRAQMLAARVEPAPTFPLPVYARDGHDYLRVLADGTLLLGGCRDVDPEGERTRSEIPAGAVQAALDDLLLRWTPDASRRTVLLRWAGTMAFTPDGLPLVGPWPDAPGLYLLTGLMGHGMGWGLGLARGLAAALTSGALLPPTFLPGRFA